MGFSRQGYWSGLPFPSPGYLPNPGIKFASPALAGIFFSIELPLKPASICTSTLIVQQLYEVSWIIIPILLMRGDCCSSTLNKWSLGCDNYQSNSRSGTLSCTLWYSVSCRKPGSFRLPDREWPQRKIGHGEEFWQNVVHWRRERQTTSVFLPWEPHEQYEKAKRYDTEKWTPKDGRSPICYWRRVEK